MRHHLVEQVVGGPGEAQVARRPARLQVQRERQLVPLLPGRAGQHREAGGELGVRHVGGAAARGDPAGGQVQAGEVRGREGRRGREQLEQARRVDRPIEHAGRDLGDRRRVAPRGLAQQRVRPPQALPVRAQDLKVYGQPQPVREPLAVLAGGAGEPVEVEAMPDRGRRTQCVA